MTRNMLIHAFILVASGSLVVGRARHGSEELAGLRIVLVHAIQSIDGIPRV